MTWLRLEDNMLDHPKWRRAIREGGDGVLAVWYRLTSWCSRNLTDGVIPADMLETLTEVGRTRDRRRALDGLVAGQLLAIDGSGRGHIVDYLERNPSRAEVLADRARRASSQKNRRSSPSVTGHAVTSEPERNGVPSHPHPIPSRPIPEGDLTHRAREGEPPPPVSTLTSIVGGRCVRTYTMPSEEPPEDFLDEAVMSGVTREQAASTWAHYFGAGLPERGVERLHRWLCQRAKERVVGLERTRARPGTRPPPRSRNADALEYALQLATGGVAHDEA